MTGIALTAILGAFLGGGWVPPGHPLSEWIRHSETMSGEIAPGTGPAQIRSGVAGSLPDGLLDMLKRLSLPGAGGAREVTGLGRFGATLLCAVEAEDSTSTETRAGTSVEAFLEPVPGLQLRERLSVWASSDENSPGGFTPFHEGAEQGRHLYVDWGYASWRRGGFEAALGRIPQIWGPGRFTSLLISDNSPPLDMLRLYWQPAGWLRFTGLTATVDSDSSTYLCAHRLDVVPYRWIRLGFSESILFSSDGLELAYMNPVIPWYPVQWNEREDDNAMLCIDATVFPARGLSAWGELLIDDLQYQTEWGRPHRLGWTAGAEWTAGATAFTGEYTRIDRFVYSQKLPRNYYLHHGSIIGSGLGPDCDRATLGISTAEAWPLVVSLRADHSRHGEGTVYEGFPDSLLTDYGFPSGTVEHSTGAVLGVSYYPGGPFEAHATGGMRWTRNLDHLPGEESSEAEGSLELVARFGL
ncbi:MAG: hypothetical protein BWX47_00384 [candidate division Hyd24-12 bacterium ADurb.Bin004]|nr:MAG: hypothetical protein BWX47_00384 [candidate division Hyd24-12 bacterium ADurb.Bin004]